MPCYYPLQAFRHEMMNSSGELKVRMRFSSNGDIKLPCGRCIGCRLERSRQWAVRIMHEANLHANNIFITLTYAPECLPEGGTLVKKHFQDFMKRLRFKYGEGIRFFHCGEYGEKKSRPHYHAIVFNFDFPDKVFYSKRNGFDVYTSESLSELWGFGRCEIGSVTFDSAAYVARYITKKITGSSAEDHYDGRLPEYTTMSRRPGIAFEHFKKFKDGIYPSDSVAMNGYEQKPPRYYDKLYELEDSTAMDAIKLKRVEKALDRADDNTLDRLRSKEQVKRGHVKRLIRPYERGDHDL